MKNTLILGLLIFATAGCAAFSKKPSDKVPTGTTQLDIYSDSKSQGKKPTLKPAKIKIKHVDDQVKDGVFIPAHLEYEISEPARWED